jgi:pimeloyl-ACP methyl ester carboxylesterase
VPVLLAWGDRDQLANIEGAPILLDAVTDSRLVVIEDCGHCPHVEFPAAIADLLLALPTSAMPDPEGGRSAAGPGEEAR